MRKEIIKQKECPECGNKAFVEDFQNGEIFCAYCGLVLGSGEDLLSSKPEWRAYNDQEQRERSRTAPFNPTKRTQIGLTLGKRGMLKPPTEQIKRLRRHQSQITSSKERNLSIATQTLQTIAGKLSLPQNTRELAMVIYKKALVEKDLVRGRTINCMVAASLYFACRILQIPRSLSDFSKITQFSKKEIANNYRLLYRKLEHELEQKFNAKVQAPNYLQLIERITGNLHLSIKTAESAAEIIKMAEKKNITQGKGPKGIAGAAIYIACRQNNESRTQKDIAYAIDVTEVTLRNRYKELQEKLKIDAITHLVAPQTRRFKIKIQTTIKRHKRQTKSPIFNIFLTQTEITKEIETLMQKCFTSLQLPNATREEAQRILSDVLNKKINPPSREGFVCREGFVAAIILLACMKTGQDITDKSIVKAAHASPHLMNKQYKRLKNILGENLW